MYNCIWTYDDECALSGAIELRVECDETDVMGIGFYFSIHFFIIIIILE